MSSFPHLRSLLLCAGLLGVLGVSGCRSTSQRVTGPLGPAGIPKGSALPGATEAIVLRHADPVYIRRPGSAGAFPLAFYHKRERVRAGAWISTGGGGRLEVLWPGSSSSVVLFDDGTLEVGDVERDEPLVRLHSLTRARLMLTPEASVELVGGAILRGDPLELSGPFVVERRDRDTIRVVNQSKRTARILYRGESLEFASGEVVDLVHLPELQPGVSRTAPRPSHPDRVSLNTPAGPVDALGEVLRTDDGVGVRFSAQEKAEIDGLGLRVRLESGEEVVFSRFAH